MATIQCKTEIPAIEGLKENELTVGREFLLVCEGDFPKNLVREKLSFVLKPEDKYIIQFLGFEFRNPTTADIKVTAYRAGQFQMQDLQLTDGSQTISLGPVQYAVQSVIQPPAQGQPPAKQEPYGPIGPASLAVPSLYWAIVAAVLGIFTLLLASKIYRIVQRKNMLERLKQHDSALSPLAQFHQSIRGLQRTNAVFFGIKAEKMHIIECFEKTYHMLKLYLTRAYKVPALEWSHRLILKDIKKHHPQVFAEFGLELEKILKEYSRGFEDKETLKEEDALAITKQCRMLVEKMERIS
ncbi:MAG: hypothetical protein ACXVCP_12415 [Bdellovibrio sp.]